MSRIFQTARFTGLWVSTRLGIKSERGATAVEYGVMVALIAAVIIVAVVALGNNAKDKFNCTATSISSGANSC
jgi:pilus assembly protein Flp/PilA